MGTFKKSYFNIKKVRSIYKHKMKTYNLSLFPFVKREGFLNTNQVIVKAS